MTALRILWAIVLFVVFQTGLSFQSLAVAQETENLLQNGSLEERSEDDDQYPSSWVFPQVNNNFQFKLDNENPSDGELSGFVDTTEGDGSRFALLNQRLDPAELRGKRVRFRAAVRTEDLSMNGRAQLWLRVDRESKEIGAFDNMQNRPITSDQWQHYDIVVDVDEDAERMVVGMLVLGKAKAWLDDASLVVVDESVAKTDQAMAQASQRQSNAAQAPSQSFFNPWLSLAALVLLIFAVSQLPNNFLQRFALRFTLVYFVLYSMPILMVTIGRYLLNAVGKTGVDVASASTSLGQFNSWFTERKQSAIAWVNDKMLGNDPLVFAPSGSGDKTEDFVYLLICFSVALLIAVVWSLATVWQKSDQVWLRDITRSYMRYVLAFTMLGYGLAKTGFIQTQFATDGVPSDFQLNRTYGESSPMGLVWTFMAASSAYTFFAGLGEVVGGVLLVFRRTATLGALVTFGVMLNVVMLNFCYDVPVKQYSFHLLVMAALIAAPDFGRLGNVLLLNRPTEPSGLLQPAYVSSPYLLWMHRVVKLVVVSVVVIIPIFEQAKREIEHEHVEKPASSHLLINRGFRWVNEVPFNR